MRKQVLRWRFRYSGRSLLSGARTIERKITERFRIVVQKSGKAQLIYSATNEQVGTVRYEYKRKQLKARIVTDSTGFKKITYKYDSSGRISEMKFFLRLADGLKLVKRHELKYSFSLQAKTGFKS